MLVSNSSSAFAYDTFSYPPPTTTHCVVCRVLFDQLLMYTVPQREICTEACYYHITPCCTVCVCGRWHVSNPFLPHMGDLRGVDHAPGTIWSTFVVWRLRCCYLKWSLALMYITLLQKSRYRAWRFQKIHTPPLGAPQLCHAHDIHLDQLLLHTISRAIIGNGASPGCIMPWCKRTDTAHEAFVTYIHPPGCTMVRGKTRHMWLDKLCQISEYCYQNYLNTPYTLQHTRIYLVHYPHLCVSHFHSHTSPWLGVNHVTYD